MKNFKWTNCIFVSKDILSITSNLTYFRYVLQLFWQLLIKLKNSKWMKCIFVSKDILTITPYYLTYFHYVLQFFWQRAFTRVCFFSAFSFFQIRMAWQSFELSHFHTTYSMTNFNLVIYIYKSSKGLFTNYVDKMR